MVDDLLEEAVLAGLAKPSQSNNDAYMIEQMERAGIILPSMMLEALAAGQVTLFTRVAEKLTGLRSALIKRLLFDPAGEGLAILCRSVDLPKNQFVGIYKIVCRARSAEPEKLARDCLRLGNFYNTVGVEASRTVIARWRRNPDYLAVLRAIDLAKKG
jgi:hypothetical protein